VGDLIAQGFLGALGSDGSFGFSGFTGLGNDSRGFGARFIDENWAACFSAPARSVRSGLAGLLQFFDDLFLGDAARSLFALSAAESPSAIFFARSSSAFTMGGHTNFIVTHARMKNTTSWATRVAFRFTVIAPLVRLDRETRLLDERVGERVHHGDTGSDQERSVDQTGQQEHLGLQGVHQFGLAGRRLEEAAAHDANADTGAGGAQTDDQASGQSNKANNLFHDNSFGFEV
jgi:hypothetical protein